MWKIFIELSRFILWNVTYRSGKTGQDSYGARNHPGYQVKLSCARPGKEERSSESEFEFLLSEER